MTIHRSRKQTLRTGVLAALAVSAAACLAPPMRAVDRDRDPADARPQVRKRDRGRPEGGKKECGYCKGSGTSPTRRFLRSDCPKCDGKGYALFDPGVTGLALLAYLGAGETHKSGRYRVHWTGRDDGGRFVASGVYFYRLRVGAWSETRKMLKIR